MASSKETTSLQRWSVSWIIAILLHLGFAAVLAYHLMPDGLVHIIQVAPLPNETVELKPAQAIEPAVFFVPQPESLNPDAALLYFIHDDGSRTLIGPAHPHQTRPHAIQFDAVFEPGTYEIVVNDGDLGITADFDGEYLGTFPTGDGTRGGSFVSRFTLAAKAHEVMTATLYDPNKPMENEEPTAKATPQPEQQIQKPEPAKIPQPQQPPKTPQPKRSPKPAPDKPTSPVIQENSSPVEFTEPVTDEPSPVVLTPQDLRITPFNFAPELLQESAEIAAQNFAERDANLYVQAANLSKQRFEEAYNADGPVVGIGQRGNSVEHKKSVAEYLALMHKEIHPLWAHGYLIRLDTIYRQPGARINAPDTEAVVEITLDSFGKVSDVRIVRSSGITDYDSEAIHVAWNSSPGITPPQEMRSNNGKSYIHWTFWRDSRQCGVFGVKVFKLDGSKRSSLDFSLKAVQLQEKKLGLTPSSIQMPDQKLNTPDTVPQVPEPLPEKINPLDD